MSFDEIPGKDYSEPQDMTLLSCRNNGNPRKDMIFAASASLAVHIGLILILSTATAMSTALRLGEVSVLHVSLVSLEAGQKTEGGKLSEAAFLMNTSAEKTKAIVVPLVKENPAENMEGKKRLTVTSDPGSIEVQSLQNTISLTSHAVASGSKGPVSASHGSRNQLAHVMMGNSQEKAVSVAVPKYRENTHPAYPWIARLRGYEGIVLVSTEVSADGSVGSVRVKKSSGYAVLDRSALDAVKTWKFEPGRKMGTPVNMLVDVPVKFVLKNNDPM